MKKIFALTVVFIAGFALTANASNFTTVPVSLGPSDSQASVVGTDGGRTGLPSRGGMGASKVTFKSQNAFSRGDSIGDISGLVTITNTGTNSVAVTCN